MKPENVLVNSEGVLKIADFGFSKKTQGRCHTICGTYEYMAPEIILGKSYSNSVDWRSLGILMYELLEGTTPFEAETPN